MAPRDTPDRTEPPATPEARAVIDPPWDVWRPTPPPGGRFPAAGVAGGDGAAARPVIATGHQVWLWHPGILAKYMATAQAARRFGAAALNVVVDHDTAEALRLELPVLRDGRLSVHAIRLAEYRGDLPPGVQSPADPSHVLRVLRETRATLGAALAADLGPLEAAWTDLPASDTLADQVATVLERLMHPYTGAIPRVHATDLLRRGPSRRMVLEMLLDARRCAACYNRAVALHPAAGIRPLYEGLDMVELPLWTQTSTRRGRVYADLGSSREPLLMTDDADLDLSVHGPAHPALAPRALLLTALMRRHYCDLFIHGKGGGNYDRITEAWWRAWRGEELAPMSVVTADLRLEVAAPLADRAELGRALWWSHHLPSNVDRALGLSDGHASRKRELLAHMDDDRDRARRAAAFKEVHGINADLVRLHAAEVRKAQDDLSAARLGVFNREVAQKRDWCFALYPPERLASLQAAITPRRRGNEPALAGVKSEQR